MGESYKTAEYYKSLPPAQLIAERGLDLVVINPGSSNLRLGLASWSAPAVIPHCISWYVPGKLSSDRKGAIGEQLTEQAPSRSERDQICLEVESLLGVRPFVCNDSQPETDVFQEEPVKRGGYQKIEQDSRIFKVQWTRVLRDSARPVDDHNFRRSICGEEALRIPATQPYLLRRPMCRGRLNISEKYSLQQVCDDIVVIWDWALSIKLSLDRQTRKTLSAVLVVPDTFDNREVKELITILLKDLEFQSVVVHQECIAATFGNGVSSACVVQLGAQVTSITCVEDGVPISATHRVLPFGGEDISRCLLWVQQRHENWPPLETNPLKDPLDMLMLDRLKESSCALTLGREPVATAEVYSCIGNEFHLYQVTLVALNVPPAGLFYPSLLEPEERKLSVRSWHHTDHEDLLVDSVDAGVVAESGTNGRNYTLSPPGDSLIGLHEAIVSSILSTGRLDLKTRFFSSILLVGGVASTRGINEFLEDKVIHSIPRHESIDRVEVLPSRADPSSLCWKGGAVLGTLDFTREFWLQRSDWIDGGPRVGSSRKYKDSISLHAQAFWYNAVLE